MQIVSGVIALDYFCDAELWIVSRCYLFIGVKNYDEKRGASRMSSMDAAKACAASDKNVTTFLNSTCADPKGESHLWGE